MQILANLMRGRIPERVVVPDKVRDELDRLASSSVAPYCRVRRAQMIQMLATGVGPGETARRLGCCERVVRKWRARFVADPRVDSLKDSPRSGRPSVVPIAARCKVVQLACERPDDGVVAFRDVWTHKALSDALLEAMDLRLSVSEIGRILRNNKLRPHVVRQWLHCADPLFDEKAEAICDIYLSPPPGVRVVSVDEKPLVIRTPKYPNRRAPDGRVRREYEYVRNGTGVLLAALSVHDGEVFTMVTRDRKAPTLVAFMEALALRWPDEKILVVWDNLNIHYDGADQRWTQFNARHGGRFSFIYTPIHASWMNQVEVWFSIVERRVLRYGSFANFDEIHDRLIGFSRHWNESEARPFRWTWRPDKSEDRLRRAA